MVIGWWVLHTEMNENVSICPDGGRSSFLFFFLRELGGTIWARDIFMAESNCLLLLSQTTRKGGGG
jgi:hypothetical protein